jgi:hypothetical protein
MTKIATVIVLLTLFLAALAIAQTPPATAPVPGTLTPGPTESLALIAHAKGVQIYECRAKPNQPTEFEWTFVAPEADLFDAGGSKIGRHYAGPHWEANDGSKVLGTVKARGDAPTPGAIPWLLLATTSVGPKGAFSPVTSIQRVNTVGGIAPKAGCSRDTAGASARIDYTADYYLFTGK